MSEVMTERLDTYETSPAAEIVESNSSNSSGNKNIVHNPMEDESCIFRSGSSRSFGSNVGSVDANSFINPSNESDIDVPMVNAISKKATKNVFHLKVLVIVILIVSASSLAAVAYTFIKRSETKQFESKFGYDAHKVLEAIGSSLDKTLGLMDSVAVTMVSYARDQDDKWPFVTLPDFGPRMAKLLPQTDAFNIAILPIIEPMHRDDWEAYSIQHDEWVNQSITIQETWDGYFGPIVYDWEQYGTIHGDMGDIETNVSRIMLPQWQNFPVIPEVVNAYNWDWLSVSTPEALQECIDTQHSIISDTYMIPNPDHPESQSEWEGWIEWHSGFINPSENSFEPVVDLFHPIVDDITHVDVLQGNNSTTNRTAVVGVVAVSIYWREFIRDILPPGSDGVVVVVETPCNLPFTYQINGPKIQYLGVLDNHESKYDDLLIDSKVVDLNAFALRAGVYTGAPISDDFCPYTIKIYPSDVMKSDFTSKNGTIAVVAILLIFSFTSFVFIMYDYSVKIRQDKVLESAVCSSAIVDSLFPAAVRNQIYDAQEKKQKRQQQNVRYLSNGFNAGADNHSAQIMQQASIAQVYPETTVIFADIVGFTSWSSKRDPTQVFSLLETLFAGFDALAAVYGVFKIETIGDSYVAVLGLPKANKRHAVVMAKFANDCRSKMQELTRKLKPILGPGTEDLALRIGLHSGPTTAGVLRGENHAFSYLVTKWLLPRSGKIIAKGKGEMQTYCKDQRTFYLSGNPVMLRNKILQTMIYSSMCIGTGCDLKSDTFEEDDERAVIAIRREYKIMIDAAQYFVRLNLVTRISKLGKTK